MPCGTKLGVRCLYVDVDMMNCQRVTDGATASSTSPVPCYAGSPNPLKKWNVPALGYPPAFHLHVAEAPGTAEILVVSGQTGTTRSDGSRVDSPAEQCEVAYEKVGMVLAAAGMSWADVVQRTIWMTEECSLAMVGAAAAGPNGVGGAMFCSSAVATDTLSEGCFVEIEVTAARHERHSPDPHAPVLKFAVEGSDPPVPPGLWPGVTVPSGSRLLFVSGQVSEAAIPDDQGSELYAQLEGILRLASMRWGDVVKRCAPPVLLTLLFHHDPLVSLWMMPPTDAHFAHQAGIEPSILRQDGMRWQERCLLILGWA